jgi:hypothetical protein
VDTNIKILIVEHDANDIELLLYELKKSGIDFESKIVQNKYIPAEFCVASITRQVLVLNHTNDTFYKILKYCSKELIAQDHLIINPVFCKTELVI